MWGSKRVTAPRYLENAERLVRAGRGAYRAYQSVRDAANASRSRSRSTRVMTTVRKRPGMKFVRGATIRKPKRNTSYAAIERSIKKKLRIIAPIPFYKDKNHQTFKLECAENQCAYYGYTQGGVTALNGVRALIKIPYYNFDTTSWVTTSPPSTDLEGVGLWPATISLSQRFDLRNNYNGPVYIEVSEWVSKSDHNVGVVQALDANAEDLGLPDSNFVTNPKYTHRIATYSTKQLWTLRKTLKVKLQPGDIYHYYVKSKHFWDPSYSGFNFKRGSVETVFRIQGEVAHSTTVDTNVGLAEAAVDLLVTNQIYAQMPARPIIKSLNAASATLDPIGGGFEIVNKEAPDAPVTVDNDT